LAENSFVFPFFVGNDRTFCEETHLLYLQLKQIIWYWLLPAKDMNARKSVLCTSSSSPLYFDKCLPPSDNDRGSLQINYHSLGTMHFAIKESSKSWDIIISKDYESIALSAYKLNPLSLVSFFFFFYRKEIDLLVLSLLPNTDLSPPSGYSRLKTPRLPRVTRRGVIVGTTSLGGHAEAGSD